MRSAAVSPAGPDASRVQGGGTPPVQPPGRRRYGGLFPPKRIL